MTTVIATLIGIFVYLRFPEKFPRTKSSDVPAEQKNVELTQVIEALRMCLQSGLTMNSAFITLDKCGVTAPIIRQTKANMSVGLPLLHDLNSTSQDYGTRMLISLLERSTQTGGSIDKSLLVLGRQLKAEAHAQRVKKIRAVSVKAVLPLGMCFLPAFVLVGVIPIAMSLGQNIFH